MAEDFIRNDNACVGPGRGAVRFIDHAGRNVGVGAFFALGIHDIPGELAVERGHIHVETGRAGEYLGVAHPAQALIHLRAVRGDAVVVASLAPADVVLYLVDKRAGSINGAADRHVAVEDAARERIRARRSWESGDLHIAEPVVSKCGLPVLRSAAFESVIIRGVGLAEVLRIDISVRFKYLREAHFDSRPRRALYLEAAPTHHVLAEVVNESALGHLFDGDRLQLLGDLDG